MIFNPFMRMEKVENGFILIHTVTQETFKIGIDEGYFLQLYSEDYNTENELLWSEEKRKQAESFFSEKGLLVEENVPETINEKKKDKFNLTKIKLFECSVDPFFEKHKKMIRILTNPISQMIYLSLIIIAIFMIQWKNSEIEHVLLGYVRYQKLYHSYPVIDIVLVYALILLTMCIHEAAHMVMCEQAGGKVGKAGVLLYFFQPALFCNLNSLYAIRDKRKKIIAFLAGIYSQWITSSIAVLVYFLLDGACSIKARFLLLYVLLNFLISLYNLIPFTKLDGYWVLGVIWNVQNLYDKSIKVLLSKLHIVANKKQPKEGRLLIYSIGAVIFYVLFWRTALIGVYNIVFHISGKRMAMMILIFFAVLIVHNFMKQMMYFVKNTTR